MSREPSVKLPFRNANRKGKRHYQKGGFNSHEKSGPSPYYNNGYFRYNDRFVANNGNMHRNYESYDKANAAPQIHKMPDNAWMQARDNLMKEYPGFTPPLVPPPFPPPTVNQPDRTISNNTYDSQCYGTYNNAPTPCYDQSNGNDTTESPSVRYGEYDNR